MKLKQKSFYCKRKKAFRIIQLKIDRWGNVYGSVSIYYERMNFSWVNKKQFQGHTDYSSIPFWTPEKHYIKFLFSVSILTTPHIVILWNKILALKKIIIFSSLCIWENNWDVNILITRTHNYKLFYTVLIYILV